jgi:uncharacterized damage-inducible protein DinB
MSIAKSLLPEFQHEISGVRRVLERIPVEHLDYRPHPKSMTLGQLANHLASMPGWICSTMGFTELDFSLPETRARMPKPSATVEGLLSTLDAGASAAEKALAEATDEDFRVIWSGKADGKVLFSMPRIAVVRSFVLNHAIHHRAQATVYLRMLDVPVPALYGPSADET